MYQQFIAIGNLGDAPQMRYTPNGIPVASFSLAINERWTNADGEKQESTLWVRVTVWRKLAEIVSEHLRKGSKVFIEGKLKPANAYTHKQTGEPMASIEVTADEVKFLDGRPEGNGPAATTAQQPPPRQPMNVADIPF